VTSRQFIAKSLQVLSTTQDWLIAQLILALLFVVRLLPVNKALKTMEYLSKHIGPHTKRHRLALANLAMAFPEKSEAQHKDIAMEMWGNMARLATEYIYLDLISKFDPHSPDDSNVEIIGQDVFADLMANPRPFIIFTIHSGNFELLPIVSNKFGLSVSVLFRPPNNRFIAAKVFKARGAHMDDLVSSKVGAAWTLARKLDDGGGVGMLIDQKFTKSAETEFFGHKVKTSPLLAKLARQYECDVFPARSIRLPDGRFRLELEPSMTLPRNDKGDIDINATSQVLNDKVEEWVREYPGQWQWFHDRWNIKHTI
jgi:KDO2-lipid IV(A) lauroyltransferase